MRRDCCMWPAHRLAWQCSAPRASGWCPSGLLRRYRYRGPDCVLEFIARTRPSRVEAAGESAVPEAAPLLPAAVRAAAAATAAAAGFLTVVAPAPSEGSIEIDAGGGTSTVTSSSSSSSANPPWD